MTPSLFLSLLTVWVAAIVSPGPDVAQVIRLGVRSRAAGVWTGLGIMTGTAVWISASMLGLSALVNTRPELLAVLQLAGGAYLPSTREDLISIAASCDKIANKCESTAKMMVLQKFTFPKEFADDVLDIMSYTHAQFELLAKSIDLLFAKFNAMLQDHSILDEIRAQESKVDAVEEKLYEAIFAMDMDLAHQAQMASFVEQICDVSDIIEDIADKIQIMLITRKA